MLMAMCGVGQVPEVKAEKKPKVEDDALKELEEKIAKAKAKKSD
jgi:hypothetical protein